MNPTPSPVATEAHDPLLLALALAARLLNHPVSAAALRAGFAVDAQGCVPIGSYPALARRQGLIVAWSTQPPAEMAAYTLPVVLPLLDGRACVLKALEGADAIVLWPEQGLHEVRLPLAELMGLHSGRALVVKPVAQGQARSLTLLRGRAFAWFWGTLWQVRGYYLESALATVLANVLTLAGVFFTMNVYDRIVPSQAYASLWTLAIGTTAAIVLEFVMRSLKARLIDLGSKRADLAINAELLREVMTIRLEHRPASVGMFASSMREFESLREFFSSASMVVLAELPFVALFVGLVALLSGGLAWVVVVAMAVLVVAGLLAQPGLMRAMRANMRESSERQSVLVETLLNLETLKATNAEGFLQRRWERSNHAAAEAYKQVRAITNHMTTLTGAVQQLTTVALVVLGVYQIGAHQLTQGALVAVVILAGRALSPLAGVMGLAARYQQARAALETLEGLMQRPRDHDRTDPTPGASASAGAAAPPGRGIVPTEAHGLLEAEQLHFAYPGEFKLPVIQGVSLRLEPGQKIGLLGRVGSGKSTLLHLLAGLYTPGSGQVRVDGVNLRQLDVAAFRSHIGYAGQDAQLFMGTLRENLVLSDGWIGDAAILDVLRRLGLYDVVARHPLGLDMPIAEAGAGLSGGQRALVALARLMLRNPTWVFLDEPTADMDQGTETQVIQVLGAWLAQRTVVLVTHRPQVLAWVDRIGVLDAGRLVAEGPKAEMIERLSRGLQIPAAPGHAAAGGRHG